MDLIAFVRARLDEDEARARAAAQDGAEWQHDGHAIVALPERDLVALGSQDYIEPEHARHITRHDPARVLAEVDAKRRIAKLYEDHERLDRETFEAEGQHARSLSSLRAAYWDACRHLALPYASHPDYRQEWKP
ncbi:DUF6221 family protein [Streptomyces sp. SBT349]|uniref:DUF6221 family protein n=1 Tax=Streptomyces sp. SBT349 TaxID=1580539 RepID=UPI00066A1597|nr:DUF6221 family protein [Streptomyces sp. SBT349]